MHWVGVERAADVASIRSHGNEQDRGNLAVLHDYLAVLGAEEEGVFQIRGHAPRSGYPKRLGDEGIHGGVRIHEDRGTEVARSNREDSWRGDSLKLMQLFRGRLVDLGGEQTEGSAFHIFGDAIRDVRFLGDPLRE